MIKTRFHTLLEAQIQDLRQKQLEHIGGGGCADYAAYQQAVGYLNGLNVALLLCDQIEKENE